MDRTRTAAPISPPWRRSARQRSPAGHLPERTSSSWAIPRRMSPAVACSARARSPWRPASTMSPRCAPPAPPGCSPISRTPARCWTPSSPHELDRLRCRRRARGQGAGRRPRGAAVRARARGRAPRVSRRDARSALRPSGPAGCAGRGIADAHLPAGRPLLPRVAPAFRGGVRGPHRPDRPHRGGSPVSTVKIPMPLRVPELAPSLGRVVVPRRVAEPWVPIDDIREALATRVLELAGEARAAATREDRERVLDAVSRRAWLAAWEQAVRRVAERLIEALDGRIERAARRVRMPQRRWRRRLLSTPEKRAVAARLATGGEPFVAALDALEAVAARVRDASVLDKAPHAEWQEALRSAARRLEAAWLGLEAVAAEEERRWSPEIEALERWRPSLWPVFVLWAPLAAALLWLGLVLGGYVPAPLWLAARLGF